MMRFFSILSYNDEWLMSLWIFGCFLDRGKKVRQESQEKDIFCMNAVKQNISENVNVVSYKWVFNVPYNYASFYLSGNMC